MGISLSFHSVILAAGVSRRLCLWYNCFKKLYFYVLQVQTWFPLTINGLIQRGLKSIRRAMRCRRHNLWYTLLLASSGPDPPQPAAGGRSPDPVSLGNRTDSPSSLSVSGRLWSTQSSERLRARPIPLLTIWPILELMTELKPPLTAARVSSTPPITAPARDWYTFPTVSDTTWGRGRRNRRHEGAPHGKRPETRSNQDQRQVKENPDCRLKK